MLLRKPDEGALVRTNMYLLLIKFRVQKITAA